MIKKKDNYTVLSILLMQFKYDSVDVSWGIL